MARDATLER
jgi:hypothetical protein